VISSVLPAGGTIVHAVTVVPPVGTVMVFAPSARVLISIEFGAAVFSKAGIVWVPAGGPVKRSVIVLFEVAILILVD